MRRLLLVLMASAAWPAGFGQRDSTAVVGPGEGTRRDELTLLAAYHQGRSGFLELGVGRSIHEPSYWIPTLCYYAGGEFRAERPELVGFKIGAYVSRVWVLGLQFIHYVEGSDREVSSGGASSMDVLRPEIGFAVPKFKFTYAYNAALTEPRIDDLNVHMLSVAITWRIGRLPKDGEPGSHRSP